MVELVALVSSVDRGRRWNVEFDGELIVNNSKDPECDAARVLLARGHTGNVTLLNRATGKPRLTLDIKRLAKLKIEEGPHGSPLRENPAGDRSR
jgi:hypothetical protein